MEKLQNNKINGQHEIRATPLFAILRKIKRVATPLRTSSPTVATHFILPYALLFAFSVQIKY
jgi:hypothetical protein